ncbi:DUF2793 domain-containing protein [Pedomonas sp. V897]|uniref:DUF2793 domain-containing protein n=1 Tax=Pedomonas sp. V897 TaxID=3446482 RepID=UPI003EE37ECD
MAETTTRHGLPLLQAGQAQKEVTHNEALAMLDLLAHPAVEARGLAEAPAAPEPGQAWIVGAGAAGAWAGQDNGLALWTTGGWRFAAARPGMLAWVKADGQFVWFDGAAWQPGAVLAAGLPVGIRGAGGLGTGGQGMTPIADPTGGAVIDAEARAALVQVLAVLRANGLASSGQ